MLILPGSPEADRQEGAQTARWSGALSLDRPKAFSLLLIASYILIIALLGLLHFEVPFNQPLLLLLLNVVFLGLIPIYVASISLDSFRRSGHASILMMGAGMLFFGLASIAAGLVGLLPDSSNLVITNHNIGACIGMFLQFAGALTAVLGWRERRTARRGELAAAAYTVVGVAAAVLLVATLLGLTPAFFVSGAGSTTVRTLVLAGAVEAALIASGLFFVLYRRRAEDFFFWYAVGVALIGLGLLAVSFYAVFDDLLNWAARVGQYIGACYILIAFMVLQRQASARSVSVQEMLTSFFTEAEAGYRQLVETAGDAIVVLDPASRVLIWNAAAETLFGYTHDEAIGAAFPDLVLAGAEILAPGEGLGGGPLVQELEALRRDGTAVPIELTASRRDVDGQVITTCIIRDLSEQKHAEAAIRESEERYRDLFESMTEGFALHEMILDSAGRPVDYRFLAVNPAFEMMIGRSADETVGHRILDLMPGLEHDWIERYGRVASTGEPAHFSSYAGPLDRWYDVHAYSPAPGRFATIFRDVTAERATTEALRESEDRYRSLIENSIDAVLLTAPDGRIFSANAEACRIFGMTEEELIRGGRNAIVDPTDLRLAAGLEERQRTGRFRGELRYVRGDGTVFPGEVSTALFTDRDGTVRATMIIRDVTERRAAEEALHRSNEELQRFAYVASHDLQEPLRSIVSFSQLLERRYRGRLDADADEYIDFIVEGGNRMQRLIRDLLQVSRIETQAQPLAPTDAGRVVAHALALFNGQIRELGGSVVVGPLPTVMADPAQLEQVFANLVGNAIKYRREGVPPEITISARRVGQTVEFSVSDNGIGIEPEYFDRIFEMFRRLHTHDEYEGTGIGLAVVKRIIERHGGRIRVESTFGEGSTFFFTLTAA